MKYSTTIALLTTYVAADCRKDSHCSSNWFKRSCCADFDCSKSCSHEKQTKISSCGTRKTGSLASDFENYRDAKGRLCKWDDSDGAYDSDDEKNTQINHNHFDRHDWDDSDDDWKVTCGKKVTKKGNKLCKDKTTGRTKFCKRRNNGTLDCSDDDDWNMEVQELRNTHPDGPQWQGKLVACEKNAKGDLICRDSDNYARTCKLDNKGRTVCFDNSDGEKEFCRMRNGKMTCSDRDHPEWWNTKVPATTPDVPTPEWNSVLVACNKNSRGQLVCRDSDGWDRICKIDRKGRTICADSDGDKKFCRMRNGKMTCSDRDHKQWWNKTPAVMEMAATQEWHTKPVVCGEPDARGNFVCRDSDNQNRNCHVDNKGRTICVDSDGDKEFCRLRNNKMSCSDRDHPEWYQDFGTDPENTWWGEGTDVRCKQIGHSKYQLCQDKSGFKAKCREDKQGRTVCIDSDGQKEFCRMRRGKMTCSDNDSHGWWATQEEQEFEYFLKDMSAMQFVL